MTDPSPIRRNEDPGAYARQCILLHWDRSISDALSKNDRRSLRFLQADIAASVSGFTGSAKARGLAVMARCAAARRYLGGRRGR